METHTGLVGFFDILGYQNLLERNEPEDIAQTVLPLLTKAQPEVTRGMKNLVESFRKSQGEAAAKDIIDSIKWLVLSDTILLTLPTDEPEEVGFDFYWMMFFVTCMSLQVKMFQAGLPLRGVINYGKFFVKETCFAGRTIVSAYQLCTRLEIAACVLTEDARRELDKQDKQDKKQSGTSSYRSFVHEYLIPLKDEEKHFATLAAHTYNKNEPNIHSQVLKSFWGHNKDVPMSVQRKISNTEQWLTFLAMKQSSSANKSEDV